MTDPLVVLFNLKGIIHLNERELTLASDGKNTVLFSDKLTYPWLSNPYCFIPFKVKYRRS